MSGYAGNSDLEAEHALILAENAVHAARSMLNGPVLTDCIECGEQINTARVELLKRIGMKCMYCISCQENHDAPPRTKMLDRIL
jgi:RNA polymerase-binding transcription factor DksA